MLRAIDHIVLTTADEPACLDFYTRVLGLELETFGADRKALRFGRQKINIHVAGAEITPHATHPRPGALDLCFLADRPLEAVIAALDAARITVLEGPVMRTGAEGPIRSIYLRDPDGNLIEIAEPSP